MIPKIIHWCWFGKGARNTLLQKCYASWEQILIPAGFTLKEWNEENFTSDVPEFATILRRRKWVLAADVARLEILYRHGGLYLDCDMEALKDLSPLLDCECFLGKQHQQLSLEWLGTGVIGASQGHPFLRDCLHAMNTYLRDHGGASQGPVVATMVARRYGLSDDADSPNAVRVHPVHFFYPKPFDAPESTENQPLPEDSFMVHHWSGSWNSEGLKFSEPMIAIRAVRQGALRAVRLVERGAWAIASAMKGDERPASQPPPTARHPIDWSALGAPQFDHAMSVLRCGIQAFPWARAVWTGDCGRGWYQIAARLYLQCRGIVQTGFFSSRKMRLLFEDSQVAARLLGLSERPMHALLETLGEEPYERFVDYSSSDGYYAVGMALHFPKLEASVSKAPRSASARIGQLARRNRVSDRVKVSEDLPSVMKQKPARRTLVLLSTDTHDWQRLVEEWHEPMETADIIIRTASHREDEVVSYLKRHLSRTEEIRHFASARRDDETGRVILQSPDAGWKDYLTWCNDLSDGQTWLLVRGTQRTE